MQISKKVASVVATVTFLSTLAKATYLGSTPQSFTKAGGSVVTNPDEVMVFAFELVRHGARAPFNDLVIDEFPVSEGNLTPQGMRERYLLGRHSRERYVDTYNLLSAQYNEDEIYVQSTNVNRTMQSGYSELMGLYPPGTTTERLTEQMVEAVESGPASPPFKVRDADQINHGLGLDALPNGYNAIQISVFNNDDIRDDVSYDGCPYINTVEGARLNSDEVFGDYTWMIDQAREPIRELFNMTDEYIDTLNYHHFESLTDTAVALDFEGYPVHETYFSDEQWEVTHEFQKVILSLRDTKDASDLEISRMLRKPLDIMQRKVSAILSGQEPPAVNYVLYSAHDDQVTNMLNFLATDYYWIPYAATVTYELKYSAKCLEQTSKSEDCFGVAIFSNGRALSFEECHGDGFTNEGCSYPEFKQLINNRWYSGPSADDLDQACFATPEPFPEQAEIATF